MIVIVDELYPILSRNIGSVLTPELLTGIIRNYASVLNTPVVAALPRRDPTSPNGSGPGLITDQRDRVSRWVSEQIGAEGEWGSHAAIGQEDSNGELVVGMVLDAITETNANMHVAISNKARLHRGMVRACFDYVFNQLGLERVTGFVAADNAEALRFDEHLGFQFEARIPMGSVPDVLQLVMWRDQCRWFTLEC